jgi:hypothetical protein
VVFHISLIFGVHWSSNWVPVFVMTGIMTADFLAMLWILVFIERYMMQSRG